MILFIGVMAGFLFKDKQRGQEYVSLIEEIQSLGRGLSKEKGFNIHHIIPKALGGKDEESNLIKLTTYEHLRAHILLALATKSPEMFFASRMMLNMSNEATLSDLEKISIGELIEASNLINESKRVLSEYQSKLLQGNSRAKGHKLSQESIQKILNTKEKNGTLKVEQLFTPEAIQNRVQSRKNRGYWNSEQTKKKISSSVESLWKSKDYREHMREAHKGKTKVWKEGKQCHIPVEELDIWLQKGYARCKKDSLK